jgi:integrase
MRDRALVSLLYVACLRVSEALRLTKAQFRTKDENGKPLGYVKITQIKLSKRKPGSIKNREARLPLTGNRVCFTKLIMDYLETLEPSERLFPWSLRIRTFVIKKHPYRLRDGQTKDRMSVQMVGTKRAYQIVHVMLPAWTQHWLRAFGESYLYDSWDHDLIAVADQVKVDSRTVEKYLVHRSAQYKPV